MFSGAKPSWLSNELDQQRIQSYLLYEQIYWNVPGVFQLSQRGTNDKPLYVPSGRTIIDTSNRYTAPGYSVSVSARGGGQDTQDVLAARLVLSDLMARERFKSKFRGAKRYCQIQGDWLWHVTADPTKPVGTRLALNTVDPSKYFPIMDPDNVERIVAVMLAEPVLVEDETQVRRVCYRKVQDTPESPVTITVEEGLFAVDAWESLDDAPLTVVRPEEALPPEITAIPVYHVKNFEEPGNPFGSSELRGFEVLMGGLNQTISDEDLTLAMQGLGMYATDAPQPVDPTTKAVVPWQLGPGRVVQHPPGTKWGRVAGVDSVAPFGDHYNRIWEGLKQASASPDVAVGTVDVQIAQSGIALALQLLPIQAKSAEKNDLIAEVHDNLWYDVLNMWYPAYEETVFTDVVAVSAFGDAVPVDRETRFKELNDMLSGGVIDGAYYRSEAAKLGYVFPEDMDARMAASAAAESEFAGRVRTELDGEGE